MNIENMRRFSFGKNWKSFLNSLHEERIEEAEKSILTLLQVDNLKDKSFLDIGSGSGIFSLSARRLGATVCSFDYDPESVECAEYLRSKYFPDDNNWKIQQGSVLDEDFLKSLGDFDIVYSWGVLHHTGNMWKAIENVTSLVKTNGILCMAIYGDQGRKTKRWWKVKKLYCSGIFGKYLTCSIFVPYFFFRAVAASIIKRENIFSKYKKNRGMSIVHDWFDWLGGFPYEVAKVEDIFHYYKDKGFTLQNIVISPGLGCNQFVFVKEPE
jgi:2-polyprenyl-6-hydroxyphenyl methylase/3-demethylubiquinone-9 3-methyltransferase